jgi:hypothetical protein
MTLHYDHPILLLQHMLWHEGYHHGQIKLALKLAGLPITVSGLAARPIERKFTKLFATKTRLARSSGRLYDASGGGQRFCYLKAGRKN